MNMKSYLLLSVALCTITASAGLEDILALGDPATECTGKVAKKRLPLFQQAEQHEQYFIVALANCQKDNTCESCPIFQSAITIAHLCALDLANHLLELEKGTDGACKVCERNEADDLKDRLVKLLNTPEAQNVLLSKTPTTNE